MSANTFGSRRPLVVDGGRHTSTDSTPSTGSAT